MCKSEFIAARSLNPFPSSMSAVLTSLHVHFAFFSIYEQAEKNQRLNFTFSVRSQACVIGSRHHYQLNGPNTNIVKHI